MLDFSLPASLKLGQHDYALPFSTQFVTQTQATPILRSTADDLAKPT